ncbi:MAG TPA: hypothetical protein VK964_04165 [Nocardioidaceae bacterium]|nr:hypothetical protein [Nocardioidaceae bacterium]
MFAYFSDVVAARRADPTDDLISALVAAEVDGERLSDWVILGFCFVMVAGGNDTTANLNTHGVMLLDGNHLAKLQARIALEELLVRQPGIGVDVAARERVRAVFTRGWVSLPATGV